MYQKPTKKPLLICMTKSRHLHHCCFKTETNYKQMSTHSANPMATPSHFCSQLVCHCYQRNTRCSGSNNWEHSTSFLGQQLEKADSLAMHFDNNLLAPKSAGCSLTAVTRKTTLRNCRDNARTSVTLEPKLPPRSKFFFVHF